MSTPNPTRNTVFESTRGDRYVMEESGSHKRVVQNNSGGGSAGPILATIATVGLALIGAFFGIPNQRK